MTSIILKHIVPNRRFDCLVRHACDTLHCEMAVISVVDPDRDRFVASHGLPRFLEHAGGCPIDQSICAHVAAMDRPLEIADGYTHPLVNRSATVTEAGLVSYLGYPLHAPSGQSIGAICVCNTRPRNWTSAEHTTIAILARITDQAIARMLSPVAA
jgi:signal transduction protein with GAF and PtsI domain